MEKKDEKNRETKTERKKSNQMHSDTIWITLRSLIVEQNLFMIIIPWDKWFKWMRNSKLKQWHDLFIKSNQTKESSLAVFTSIRIPVIILRAPRPEWIEVNSPFSFWLMLVIQITHHYFEYG